MENNENAADWGRLELPATVTRSGLRKEEAVGLVFCVLPALSNMKQNPTVKGKLVIDNNIRLRK